MKNFKTAKRLKITKQKKRWVKNRMCLSINVTQKWWKDAFTLFCPCMSVCLSFCSTLGYVSVSGKSQTHFFAKNLKIYFYHGASKSVKLHILKVTWLPIFYFFWQEYKSRWIVYFNLFIWNFEIRTFSNYSQLQTKSYKVLLFVVFSFNNVI